MTALRRSSGEKSRGFLLALPAILWMVLFFLLPLLFVLVMSFLTRGRGGVGELPFTLENYDRVRELFFGRIDATVDGVLPFIHLDYSIGVIDKSVFIAFVTTVFCLLIGYPLAFFISTRKRKSVQQFALFLIILPFWTNFLVRTYALQTIMGREGIFNSFIQTINLVTEPIALLNTQWAVVIGLVYGFLPFMVLPIYASVERFDFRFVEAAYDLGANDLWAFLRIVLPMTLPGVIAGCVLVFIPTIGAFVTPDLLGGTQGIMIGNLINTQFKGSGNQPLGSALSMVLMGTVMLSLIIYVRYGDRES